MKFAIFFFLFMPSLVFAAGTVTITRSTDHYEKVGPRKGVEVVTIKWVGSASDGSVPSTTLSLHGFIEKALAIPGSPSPTASYGVALDDPNSSSLDALGSTLTSLSASTPSQKAPVLSGSNKPVFVDGTYTFAVSGNSVDSAQGTIVLYLTDQP